MQPPFPFSGQMSYPKEIKTQQLEIRKDRSQTLKEIIGKYSVTVPILKLLTKNLEQCSELRKGRSDPIFPRSYIDAASQGLT